MTRPSPAAPDHGRPVPASDDATAWNRPQSLAVESAPVPQYGSGSLADLLPTLAAGSGVPGVTATLTELPPADRNCVFLIDGLGWHQLLAHPAEAPFLSSLIATSRGGTLAGDGWPLVARSTVTTRRPSFSRHWRRKKSSRPLVSKVPAT